MPFVWIGKGKTIRLFMIFCYQYFLVIIILFVLTFHADAFFYLFTKYIFSSLDMIVKIIGIFCILAPVHNCWDFCCLVTFSQEYHGYPAPSFYEVMDYFQILIFYIFFSFPLWFFMHQWEHIDNVSAYTEKYVRSEKCIDLISLILLTLLN